MSSKRYPPELRERAVRMVLEQRGEYSSTQEAIRSIAPKIGCCADTLRVWMHRHEQESSNTSNRNTTPPLTSDERQRLKERSALSGRASRLRRSDGVHDRHTALYSAVC